MHKTLTQTLLAAFISAPCGWSQPLGTRPSRAERGPSAILAATKVLARYGLKWKRPPQIHKFDHKVRICGFYVYPDGRVELRDRVYLNGKRLGARLLRKRKGGKKPTAYDAQKMTSYSARFKAFGCYRAFVAEILHNGKLTMSDMASIISRHDRAKAKARQGDVQKS